jgi:ribulose-5-phosphate 4-epimerase/fuculose-1-phosphate aldolase
MTISYLPQKEDLTAALRWAAREGLNEGVCNHFSLEVAPDRYLINPQGLHWEEVRAGDMLLINGQGSVIEGRHPIEPSAFFIHSWIHRLNPHAKAVLHTHMPYATALTLVEGGRLQMSHQNALRFWGRVGYDDVYGGVALDAAEGERIGRAMRGKDVMFMASHGVTVTGATLAWAFDDLYYLERACMHQVLATQAAAYRERHRLPGHRRADRRRARPERPVFRCHQAAAGPRPVGLARCRRLTATGVGAHCRAPVWRLNS